MKRVQLISPRVAGITRRQFGLTLGGAALAALIRPESAQAAFQTWEDFTLAFLPDTQYLVDTPACGPSPILADLMSFIVTVRDVLNIKACVGVGDCSNVTNGTSEGTNDALVRAGYDILFNGGIPAFSPPGNHDYVINTGSGFTRSNVGWGFKSGYMSPATTRSRFGTNGLALANPASGYDDRCWYGGNYDETAHATGLTPSNMNAWYKAHIGPKKLLIFCLEFHPRGAILDWARGIAAANPDYDVIVLTHSYLQHATGTRFDRTTLYGGVNYGPQFYGSGGQGAYPASSTGIEQWNNCYKLIENAALVGCGHWFGSGTNTYWINPDTGDAGNNVVQLFGNNQLNDLQLCDPAWTASADYANHNIGQVFFLTFKTTGVMELSIYTIGKGQWVQAGDRTGHTTYGVSRAVVQSTPMVLQSGKLNPGVQASPGVAASGKVS